MPLPRHSHAGARSALGLAQLGSVIVKVVLPGFDDTVVVPWWAWTIAATSDSPRPAPPLARVRDVSPRVNRSKACSASPGGSPGPSSCTEMVVPPAERSVDTVTVVPGG